jgi:putative flippase GtrA
MPFEKLLSPRFARFVLVGGLNTALSYALYLVLLWIGLPYPIALAFLLSAAVVLGFMLSGTFVFGDVRPARFVLYVLSWFVIYLINVALTAELVAVGIHEAWAPLLILPLNVVLSYWTQRTIVFRQA